MPAPPQVPFFPDQSLLQAQVLVRELELELVQAQEPAQGRERDPTQVGDLERERECRSGRFLEGYLLR